jgi:Predicted acetyltransferase
MINIRLETPLDYRAVEEFTREAFWGFTHPTCDEHYLVHILRKSPVFIPELDFVAEIDGKLAGNVMYSKATVTDDNDVVHEVITFGPLSVLPEYHRTGVGTALMKHSILKARDMGFRGIIFHGHPDYYPRFGFQNASVFNITNTNGHNYDALMAMELYKGAFNGITGRYSEDSLFEIDEKEAEDYNLLFPYKEPAYMIPIDILLNQLPEKAKSAFTNRDITTLAWLNRLSGREMMTWDGIGEAEMAIINRVLNEYGYAEKLMPDCEILQRAKTGINYLILQLPAQ